MDCAGSLSRFTTTKPCSTHPSANVDLILQCFALQKETKDSPNPSRLAIPVFPWWSQQRPDLCFLLFALCYLKDPGQSPNSTLISVASLKSQWTLPLLKQCNILACPGPHSFIARPGICWAEDASFCSFLRVKSRVPQEGENRIYLILRLFLLLGTMLVCLGYHNKVPPDGLNNRTLLSHGSKG